MEKIIPANTTTLPVKTYINCDLRYFNLKYLTERLGSFDVVLIDPPWRIKGGERNDSPFMFSNNKFSLEYNTLSNAEIINIKVEDLAEKGFCFLWVLNCQLEFGQKCLKKWGYDLIDQIVWIKTRKNGNKVAITHGYYFLHSYEICLVGYKAKAGDCVEFVPRVSNNVIFADINGKSEKPTELYEIIELMMPGAKKIELFARNNNLRHGWFSLGNELGEEYAKFEQQITCDSCHKTIEVLETRYKSRKKANHDLCDACIELLPIESRDRDFFKIANLRGKEQLHYYHKCDNCGSNPIRGTRFTCCECENYDLCENCYDQMLSLPPSNDEVSHVASHRFKAIDFPIPFGGCKAHEDCRCFYCSQKPIVGICFVCVQCKNLSVCQQCFFAQGVQNIQAKGHSKDHAWEVLAENVEKESSQLINFAIYCDAALLLYSFCAIIT
eukprot:TRINITY_DN135226_c1_g1_i1.p1 TRINITY_DN135226_c1_g1~~TRINITY_DN135226_c1_g1_i1.p1  ORF type:complete len:440 (+),score=35.88 TRINITY_DN135226_c1_g1_i1:806-2125(+)